MLKLLFILLISANTFAQTNVNGVWAFNIANTQGSYFRHILENANTIQKKYNFIVENKPGAGGAVAAQSVLSRNNISLLGTSTAFFIRPNLYSTTPYNYDQFKVLHLMNAASQALTSKTKDLQTIIKQNKITIGTAGTGSTQDLMSLKFKEYFPNKDIELIPYKSSTDAILAVLGEHIDLAYENLGDAESKGVKILGTTGTIKIKNYPLLKDIGYPNQSDLVGLYLILVKKDVSDENVIEIRNILLEAEKNYKVQELYALDYVHHPVIKDYNIWYRDTIKHWESITKGMKVE
jgi:tripartite-type tricarboxylate transporter receptor subunit TctC